MNELLHILIVEDVPDDASLAGIQLRKGGFEFRSERVFAKNTLLKALPEFNPDVVLCDYLLPGFDGLEALSIIKEFDPLIPVIMFTGRQNETVAVECMKAGASDYILKESITRLPYAVKEALEKARLLKGQVLADAERKRQVARLEELNKELSEARQATLNIMEDLNAEMEKMERVQNELSESEMKYRQLFESMAQGVFYQNASGTIADANPSALRIVGLTRDEFLRRTSLFPGWKVVNEHGDVIPGEQHPSMIALKTGKPVNDITVGIYIPQDDKYNWAIVNAVPEFHPGEEKPYRVAVTLHDITERKEAENSLKEKMDELERFNDLTVGRELDMIDLKKEINHLLKQLGNNEKYKIVG